MIAAMKVIQTYREHAPEKVQGLHLEGPWMNSKRRGIHNPVMMRTSDQGMLSLIKSYRRQWHIPDSIVRQRQLTSQHIAYLHNSC